eukprot:417356-Amorphochlora_amoeboformis.AAC.1
MIRPCLMTGTRSFPTHRRTAADANRSDPHVRAVAMSRRLAGLKLGRILAEWGLLGTTNAKADAHTAQTVCFDFGELPQE